MRYRIKPFELEAVRCDHALSDAGHNWQGLPQWLRNEYEQGNALFLPRSIEILVGKPGAGRVGQRAELTDWILNEPRGITVCPHDVFMDRCELIGSAEESK